MVIDKLILCLSSQNLLIQCNKNQGCGCNALFFILKIVVNIFGGTEKNYVLCVTKQKDMTTEFIPLGGSAKKVSETEKAIF
jgi:hypothetical protein